MDRLCYEVQQLVFFQLQDPTNLSRSCKAFHQLSKDPYTRAHYFLVRYGQDQALYFALARGKVLTERVLEILLSSGARLSRYFCQIAMHVYFQTQHHSFVKLPWVRNVDFTVFTQFMKIAASKYGDIPRGKNEDDGSIFSTFIKQGGKTLSGDKQISWETIREILETYDFMPFSTKDPLMAQFPLALAIEPRLLPYATANGFNMDPRYRDFVFRKMFEKTSVSASEHVNEIIRNVRELCHLDSRMFLSRTVAAEVCMEATTNEPAYDALKRLNNSGDLAFELSNLVHELISLLSKTRSITTSNVISLVHKLYSDFPTADPKIRQALVLTAFFTNQGSHDYCLDSIKNKVNELKLGELTRRDIYLVLINPFVEKYSGILAYARKEVQGQDKKGLTEREVKKLLLEVIPKCLEISCKGKFIRRVFESKNYEYVLDAISRVVLTKHQLEPSDFPDAMGVEDTSRIYTALSREYETILDDESEACAGDDVEESTIDDDDMDIDESDNGAVSAGESENSDSGKTTPADLGPISTDSLSTSIRQDELLPARMRRRYFYGYNHRDLNNNLPYPSDPTAVARWVKSQFGVGSAVTAVFLTHAIVNNNHGILSHFFPPVLQNSPMGLTWLHVPITLKHFRILARLGKAPNPLLWAEIEKGAEFYRTENDYLNSQDPAYSVRQLLGLVSGKETNTPSIKRIKEESPGVTTVPPTPSSRKRPRRSAASSVSYVVPDSDDEEIARDDDKPMYAEPSKRKHKPTSKARPETHLQLWIKHLGLLEDEEKAKYKTKKKHMEEAASSERKARISKTEFFKSLSGQLKHLRWLDQQRTVVGGEDEIEDYVSSEDEKDDSDYILRSSRLKRRRTSGD